MSVELAKKHLTCTRITSCFLSSVVVLAPALAAGTDLQNWPNVAAARRTAPAVRLAQKAGAGDSDSGTRKAARAGGSSNPVPLLKQDATLRNWMDAPSSGGSADMQATLKSLDREQLKQPGMPSWGGSSGIKGKTTAGSDTANNGAAEQKGQAALLMMERSHNIDLKAVGETIVSLRRQVTDDPSAADLKLKLGTNLYLAGDYDGAASEIKGAIELRPNDAIARAMLGKVLDFVGDHGEALTQFRRAVELYPDNADVHLLFADSLARGANVAEAVSEYRRAIAIKPSAAGLSGLSESLLASGDAAAALKAARQAVSLEPSSAAAQVALTSALLHSDDLQSALRTARQASMLNPNFPDGHLALGRCLYASGETNGAVEEFKQAVALDPLNARARNDLGYALYGQGDILSAISEYRLALRLNPRLTEARNNLEVAIYRLTGVKGR